MRSIVAVWMLLVAGLAPAVAEQRLALVIGNDQYENLPAEQQLRKAANDARAVADALRRIGFRVFAGENLGRPAMVDKLDEFTRQIMPGDTALFFFAGHGVAVGSNNYILPSDVPNVQADQEVRLTRAALSESDIVSDLQVRGARIAVMVLDACRNNPFRRSGTRGVGAERGFRVPDQVRGVFSLYSAGFGQAALDRLSDDDPNPNSLFTRILVPALDRPGIDLGAMAVGVKEDVAKLAGTIGYEQYPAYYDGTIGGRVYLNGTRREDAAYDAAQTPVSVPSPVPSAAVDVAVSVAPGMSASLPDPPGVAFSCGEAELTWRSLKETTSVKALETFRQRYEHCPQGILAQARIDDLKGAAPVPAAPGVNYAGPVVVAPPVVPRPVPAQPVVVAPPINLLDALGSVTRWAKAGACGSSSLTYTLTIGGGSVVWRSGRGQTDVETVIQNTEDEFRTRTTASPAVRIGQIWVYRKVGANRIHVTEVGRNAFELMQCP